MQISLIDFFTILLSVVTLFFYNYHSNSDNEISKLYKFNLNLLQF